MFSFVIEILPSSIEWTTSSSLSLAGGRRFDLRLQMSCCEHGLELTNGNPIHVVVAEIFLKRDSNEIG